MFTSAVVVVVVDRGGDVASSQAPEPNQLTTYELAHNRQQMRLEVKGTIK